MAGLMDLYDDYRDAARNKGRNPDYVAFDLHRCANLRKLRRGIAERSLRPSSRAYVVFRPVVREVYSSEMAQCVVEHRLQRYLRPAMERDINGAVCNNLPGRGLERALNRIAEDVFEVSEGYTKDCWCAVADLSGYFPNARQDRVYSLLEGLLLGSGYPEDLRDELLYLLRASIYFNARRAVRMSAPTDWAAVPPRKSLLNKPGGVGAAPGKVIMQLAMTYYHDEVVKWLISCGARVTVYGDDFAFVFSDKERFLRLIMPEFRRRMRAIGCEVHPRKFYCQHYTKGVRFCSQMIKPGRIYAGRRTVRNFFRAVGYWRRHTALRDTGRMLGSLNSYFGLLRNRQGYAVARRGYESLPARWKERLSFDSPLNVLKPRKGYGYCDLICEIYNLHLYDKTGHHKRHRIKAA